MGIIILLLLTVFGLAFLLGGKALSQHGIFFVEPKEGEIIAVMRGGSLSELIITNDGTDIDTDNNVDTTKQREKGFLEKHVGIKWIGPWPFYKVHTFEVSVDKLKEGVGTPIKPESLDEFIAHRDKREVNFLLYKIPRPVLLADVEFPGDNAQVDMLFRAIVRVVNPYKFLFIHKANTKLVDEAIESAVINYCQKVVLKDPEGKLNYRRWLQHDKEKGSNFIKSIFLVNNQADSAPLGIVEQYGIELEEIHLIRFEADESTRAIADSLRREEAAKGVAKGVIATAHGEAMRIVTLAKARAQEIRLLTKAEAGGASANYNAVGGTVHGSNYLNAREWGKAVAEAKPSVIGANPLISIPLPPEKEELRRPKEEPVKDGDPES